MLGYMPSEIARLVLGYLQTTRCERSEKAFLSENPYIQEYAQCLRAGRSYPTNIEGKGLQKILDDYYLLTHPDGQSCTNVEEQGPSDHTEDDDNVTRDKKIEKHSQLRKVVSKSKPKFKTKNKPLFKSLGAKQNIVSMVTANKNFKPSKLKTMKVTRSERNSGISACKHSEGKRKQSNKHKKSDKAKFKNSIIPILHTETSSQSVDDHTQNFSVNDVMDKSTSPFSPYNPEPVEDLESVCDLSLPLPSKASTETTDTYNDLSIGVKHLGCTRTSYGENSAQCSESVSKRVQTQDKNLVPPDCGLEFSEVHEIEQKRKYCMSNERFSEKHSRVTQCIDALSGKRNEFIDLCSPDPKSSSTPLKNFLGVSSQDTPLKRECPESLGENIMESDPKSDPGKHISKMSANSEADEAWRLISMEKERLEKNDKINSALLDAGSSEKENQEPQKACRFKKPSASMVSPYKSSPFHASDTNSPKPIIFSPSMVTPLNSVEPDLPSRYPGEDSPRLILSQRRAAAPIPSTPVKEYHQAILNQNLFISPKRKSNIPRRRLPSSTITLTPSKTPSKRTPAKLTYNGNIETNDSDYLDFWNFFLDERDCQPFINKLTENINKVMPDAGEETMPANSQEPSLSNNYPIPENVVKDILTETESDPLFEVVLNKFLEKLEPNRQTDIEPIPGATSVVALPETTLNDTIPMEEQAENCTDKQITDSSEPADKIILSAAQDSSEQVHATSSTVLSTPTGAIDSGISSTCNTSETTNLITLASPQVVCLPPPSRIPNNVTFIVQDPVNIPSSHSSFQKILPSPKKDILQKTLESLQIESSPAKNVNLEALSTCGSQNVNSSEYGTCIQVINQPIMSSKATGTVCLNVPTQSPVKLISIPAFNVITYPPGQLYNTIMSEDLRGDSQSKQRSDLPIFVQAPTAPVRRKVQSRLAASRPSFKKWVSSTQTKRNGSPESTKNSAKAKATSDVHVRALNFGSADTSRGRSDSVETTPSSDGTASDNAGVEDNRVIYINSEGQEEHVSTIDMSELSTIQVSASGSGSQHQSPTPSIETENAAATLISLARQGTTKAHIRIATKDSSKLKARTARKRKSSSGKKEKPKEILKKMNIDKFLSSVHQE